MPSASLRRAPAPTRRRELRAAPRATVAHAEPGRATAPTGAATTDAAVADGAGEDVEDPGRVEDYRTVLNPDSLEVVPDAKVEPAAAAAPVATRFQFERIGYFAVDPDESMSFHRTVGLRDEWANIQKRST